MLFVSFWNVVMFFALIN